MKPIKASASLATDAARSAAPTPALARPLVHSVAIAFRIADLERPFRQGLRAGRSGAQAAPSTERVSTGGAHPCTASEKTSFRCGIGGSLISTNPMPNRLGV